MYCRKVRVNINGNNNTVVIDDGAFLHYTKINIGFPDCPINNCYVHIGKNTRINGAFIQLGEQESEVTIGEDCLISDNVEISCTDTHSICDFNGNLLNLGKFIHIGKHVWICRNATILKNVEILNDCVIAQGSTVTRSFEKSNCILAGIPAKVVKEEIIWNAERPENSRKKISV